MVMNTSSGAKGRDLVANMRQTVSKAAGVVGLTVAVSLPAANVNAAVADNDYQDIAKALQQVQDAAKSADLISPARASTGEKLAQWFNWRNWNNWRNY